MRDVAPPSFGRAKPAGDAEGEVHFIDVAPSGERRGSGIARRAERRPGLLARAVNTIFGDDDEEQEEEGATEAERRRALFARIGTFLEEQGLDPSPGNYDLAYQFVTSGDRKLVVAVESAIRRDGALTAENAELILAECRTDMSAEALAKLVEDARSGLTQIAGLVKQSGADAQAYGEALETSAADIESLVSVPGSLSSLLGLTRSMIDKTKLAELQLRATGKQMSSLRGSLEEARQAAESDALTGLANRRAFEAKLKASVAAARSSGKPLSLAFCDIDNFKLINDTHGHEVGDRILKFVAKQLSAVSGDNCHVARHGGEEFVILFENLGPQDAFEIVDASRIDLATRRLVAKQSGDAIGRVTFSAGVAGLGVQGGGRELMRHADQALYRAKRDGRDRVVKAG